LGLFEEINESGTTVLFATHDRTLLEVRPHRVVVLDDGKMIDVPQGIASEEYDNRLPL
jgi:cell division transport system ATP-binding protein